MKRLQDDQSGNVPNAKMLFCKNDSKSARGVAGVMRVYGCDASRLNLIMYCETLSSWVMQRRMGHQKREEYNWM
jgi:hypothetical protein